MSTRAAVIDLGTNTVRLLVAELRPGAAWSAVHAEQRVTRLGEGLTPGGALGETPMARTRAAVAGYVARAREEGATIVRVVGTSAVREAANGRAFADDLAAATGARVDVISGDDEARLTLRGLRRGLTLPAGAMIAFDIGGGSTEYVLARDGALTAAVSLRLGVVPLTERYPFAGPVEPARFAALLEEVRARLAGELPRDIADAALDVLVGTAGTVTTLAALDLDLAAYDPERVHGHRLTRGAVDAQLARLGALPVEARGALPCLEPGRADLIVPGIAIVIATMERLRADALVVSEYGLREGIMDLVSESP
ncbi:MAG TPA: Ppx/GppA phosphatase family protein [Terriglobales bacterium]|nr:Ppx/GppA phosphatase family protein [Terriglobales bacterium]